MTLPRVDVPRARLAAWRVLVVAFKSAVEVGRSRDTALGVLSLGLGRAAPLRESAFGSQRRFAAFRVGPQPQCFRLVAVGLHPCASPHSAVSVVSPLLGWGRNRTRPTMWPAVPAGKARSRTGDREARDRSADIGARLRVACAARGRER
ncbi:MAG: hypothetical protein MUC86_01170, partial [Burkholderiaceae bacterium]|nr:hypothetical protein [Burkholderiaceae bacterium]